MKNYKHYTSDGQFLKKSDVDPPITVTISGIQIRSIAAPGKAPRDRLVASFAESSKQLPINAANGDTLCELSGGQEDAEKWVGLRIELYVKPDVSFAGQRTGGIRVRKPTDEPF